MVGMGTENARTGTGLAGCGGDGDDSITVQVSNAELAR